MNRPKCLTYRHHQLAGFWSCLSGDIGRYLTKSPNNVAAGNTAKTRISAFLTPELLCLALYRISHYLYVKNFHRTAALLSCVNTLLRKISITQSCIGPGCRLPHPGEVTFHGCAGSGLTLYALAICCSDTAHIGGPVEMGPCLGDRVTVGGRSVLMGSMTVGDDAKVGFSVNLSSDVPARTLVISKVNRKRFVSDQTALTHSK